MKILLRKLIRREKIKNLKKIYRMDDVINEAKIIENDIEDTKKNVIKFNVIMFMILSIQPLN